ncbi:MAG TPA: hypothetical protein VFX50_14230, partial [Gemmatimonadales bacterium]|nr:hypothetical protein [Gemmatimonadales bacterium]
MRLLLGADWLTVGILAVIALAEGARRIPDGALILRALGLSDWLVLEGRDGRSRLRFVSWWPPFTRHVVLLPATEGVSRSRREITERLQLVDRRLGALESLGALQVVTLVLGVPILSARFSATGFIASLVAVVVLTACCAIVAY